MTIGGRLLELGPLRHTPAGIPTVEFRLEHRSAQEEAGGRREVEAEIGAVAFQTAARLIAECTPGRELKVEGFLCAKSRRSKKLVLHVTNIEFIEGA